VGHELVRAARAGEGGAIAPLPGIEVPDLHARSRAVAGPRQNHPGRCAWHVGECISTPGGHMALETGKKAPDFTLLDQDGEKVKLSGFKGKTVVVFFYPKALTSG
jgi:hypothetical protein